MQSQTGNFVKFWHFKKIYNQCQTSKDNPVVTRENSNCLDNFKFQIMDSKLYSNPINPVNSKRALLTSQSTSSALKKTDN
jgi:hypothetical protein